MSMVPPSALLSLSLFLSACASAVTVNNRTETEGIHPSEVNVRPVSTYQVSSFTATSEQLMGNHGKGRA